MAFAGGLTDLLDDNRIPYEVETSPLIVNPLQSSGAELSLEYVIKLRPQDFNTVNILLEVYEEKTVEDVNPNYPLYSFSDDELHNVLKNSTEWTAFDQVLARKILDERGAPATDEQVEEYWEEEIEALTRPEESEATWIIIGYLTAFLGGFLGIFIGAMMWKFKKTLPNGERVYAYTRTSRINGLVILIIGVIVFAIAVASQVFDYSLF
ncbi:hypothetical protein BEL04_21080 [Mucilaginibacter sp. PPCGB 2223]|nr:hypothetical protein BEL04_21080 [Mucilaginibacter sp. PPCGB 2223]